MDVIREFHDTGKNKTKRQARLPDKEIRIILDVDDPQAETLVVRGVKKIELADFWSGALNDRERKRQYLYRELPSNMTWHFSPIYKLGSGVKDGRKKLLGKEGDWRSDKDSRFYKFYKSTLKAFEERAVFSPGAVDKIMDALVERVDELASYWTEEESSYLLIVSVCDGDSFLYPVEVKSYLNYFRSRLTEELRKNAGKAYRCAICHSSSKDGLNLDGIFAFSTFDKKGFLPGGDKDAKWKNFPVCYQCYKLLSEGSNVVRERFLDRKSIGGVNIYIISELLLHNASLKIVSSKFKNFLQAGLANEVFLSEEVLEQGDEIVFHFVFWEQNQSQERLLLMVEDVSPSRLKHLEELWKDSVQTTQWGNGEDSTGKENPARSMLAAAINLIAATIMSLAGKNKEDTQNKGDACILKDLLLDVVGRLLKGDIIDVYTVKSVIVSRLQGLFADNDWVAKYGEPNMRSLQRIVDFFYRVNEG
jgi:CRISPR-associated protein Csh1